MSDQPTHTRKDSHYARLRRAHRDRAAQPDDPRGQPERRAEGGPVQLYGLHTVDAALANPRRRLHRLLATKNALNRLAEPPAGFPCSVETVEPRLLDRMLGGEAVHQGVLLEADALAPVRLPEALGGDLILVLDQVTDPHNVGAILRSAVAFGASALVTTARHSPQESGVLAKAASGALEFVPHVEVVNLALALGEIAAAGYRTVGLDSEGAADLEGSLEGTRLALVLGSEGKGLRQKTRETVDVLARLEVPGAIRSLNVSNAAAVSLYAARRFLG